jgi:hypothetical protein
MIKPKRRYKTTGWPEVARTVRRDIGSPSCTDQAFPEVGGGVMIGVGKPGLAQIWDGGTVIFVDGNHVLREDQVCISTS